MTWNCRGIADANKFGQLTAYRTAKAIDTVFLQEGGDEHDSPNAGGTRVTSFDEQHGGRFGGISNTFAFGNATRTEQALRAAFQRQDYTGIGSDGSNKKYTIVSPAAVAALAPTTPDYANDADISTFVLAPATAWLSFTPPPDPLTHKRKRANSLDIRPSRAGYELVVGGDLTKEAAKSQVHGPTANRINLLPRRRPRCVVMQINGANYDVYFWHAPLGGSATLESLNLTPAYTPCKGHASGGDVALIVNILFARYLQIGAAFPANVLLVGDLNIDATAVQAIYRTNNILSSRDGWCHAIAAHGVAMNQRFAGEFAPNGADYECNVGGYDLLTSDHAPVIFDI
jgi:hypothetical protein